MSTESLVQRIITKAADLGIMLATAESCTGGMIAAALTDIAGSSVAVDRGFITYSNAAKTESLDVPAALIVDHGAVSEPVVRAMAEGAVARISGVAGIAVSVSGVAGPGGGTAEKPVGLVWFGLAHRQGERITTQAFQMIFSGDRAAVRQQSVNFALEQMSNALDEHSKAIV